MIQALFLVLAMLIATTGSALSEAHFYGKPFALTFGDNGRDMTLQADMGFIDASNNNWSVKAPFTTDGASIPQVAWSFIGGPFDGPYRDAAIVHDYYCIHRNKPWRAVHRMFYEASIVAGTDPVKAKVMYAAVYFAGPRWGELGGATRGPGGAVSEEEQRARLNELQNWIEANQPSLKQIESRVDSKN